MRRALSLFFVFLSLIVFVAQPTSAYAWRGHSYVGVNFGVWPGSYYYGSPYYRDYAPEYVLVSSSYQPVVVNGATYYVNNGVYYVYTEYGYQAVVPPTFNTAPVVQAPLATAMPVDSENTFSINIPNNKGGYTAVVLKKSGNGFIGPQGEFYTEFPKVSQLQVIYGK